MPLYRDQVVPRIVDKACGLAEVAEVRARVTAGLRGTVLEVGFGSGLNLAHLPPEVERLLAVDPSSVGRRLAGARLAEASVPVDFVGLDGEALPLPDASVDAALSTFTLCTIPDVGRALGELRRVLRPDGLLHLVEHGLSPQPRVATWQHRLTPLQRRLFAGCHLDRPIRSLLVDAGFDVVGLGNEQLAGPKVAGYLYVGTARRP